MDINLPILGYYPKDNSRFVDPMYAPYEKIPVALGDKGCHVNVSTWQNMPNVNMVHPDQWKMNWNQDFKRLYPNDKCPPGFVSSTNNDGMCSRGWEEAYDSNFYTPNQFGVANQYWDGYTANSRNPANKIQIYERFPGNDNPTFSASSINPWNGDRVVYFEPKHNKNSTKYNLLPSRRSYLGV
jgi:hypothetical protein